MAEGVNNVMWGPLLEKGYARFIGTYERIAIGGVASEAIRAMTNFPGFLYKSESVKDLWTVIDQALEKGDIVTCSTPVVDSNHLAKIVKNQLGIV